ncbi:MULTISPECIES: NAD(P)H-dependent oxidoreductase [Acetobacterium]|jgi:nitroreductase|uniref:NAD(P)H-dependent oxidoreductase n=1 Tax=Acetobacterium TaxID=33951 RepID=UPI00203392BB|nr:MULTISPECIES: NAD(P)H-dependent oxidoreductase [Acetobacterium]URN84517.1 NAD(P)H-dependent oxidoreductase [Acetobacterium wieringae]
MKKEETRNLILNIFNNRYTCKGYDANKKVSDEDFAVIMEAARLSPSSMGLEPWKFVLLNNRELREKIKPFAWGAEVSLDGASHFVLILARKPVDLKPDSDYVEYIMNDIQHFTDDLRAARKNKLKSFQEDDLKIAGNDRAFFDWACKQTYIPLANMLTAAAMLGVDSTPMEGFNTAKVEAVLVQEKILDPVHFGLSCMIAFGYKNRDHRPKTRRKIEEILETIE